MVGRCLRSSCTRAPPFKPGRMMSATVASYSLRIAIRSSPSAKWLTAKPVSFKHIAIYGRTHFVVFHVQQP